MRAGKTDDERRWPVLAVRVPAKLKARLKIRAVELDVTMQCFVGKALCRELGIPPEGSTAGELGLVTPLP